MKQIGIDLDVHRALEHQRRAFSESENDILRRLLISPADTPVPPAASFKSQLAPTPPTRTRGLWTVEVLGSRTVAANLKDAYRSLLHQLASSYPSFLEKFSQERSRSRHFVARSKEALYETSPHLAEHHARPLKDGWFFDTNLSTEQVARRIRVAARVCGLLYGTDVRILENLREI